MDWLPVVALTALLAGFYYFYIDYAPSLQPVITGAATTGDLNSDLQQTEDSLKLAKASGFQTLEAEALLAEAKILRARGNKEGASSKLNEVQAQLLESHARGVQRRSNFMTYALLFSISGASLLYFFFRPTVSSVQRVTQRHEPVENEKFARFTTPDDVVSKLTKER